MTDSTASSPSAYTRHIVIPTTLDPILVLGTSDQVLRSLERGFSRVGICVIGRDISLTGIPAEVDLACELVEELIALAAQGEALDASAVDRAISLLSSHGLNTAATQDILTVRGKTIRPKTPGQLAYVEAIERATVVFGIGPAGTGKTYLAMAVAVRKLLAGQVRRIILTRPAVEAGENLGFLPGTLTDKIDPYLRPLYDALKDMLEAEAIPKLMAAGTIEVAPLAYMRGRTLNDAFIILDEAQNTTANQMKMFLTRLGFHSQIVVTGDSSQVDLPGGSQSGLALISRILDGIDDIEFCQLTSADVVRHELVGEIIDAYSRWEEHKERVRAMNTRSRARRNRNGQESPHD